MIPSKWGSTHPDPKIRGRDLEINLISRRKCYPVNIASVWPKGRAQVPLLDSLKHGLPRAAGTFNNSSSD